MSHPSQTIVALVVALSLGACGGSGDKPDQTGSSVESNDTQPGNTNSNQSTSEDNGSATAGEDVSVTGSTDNSMSTGSETITTQTDG